MALKSLLIQIQCCHISNNSAKLRSFVLELYCVRTVYFFFFFVNSVQFEIKFEIKLPCAFF